MKFISEIWHPNIDKNGDVCISILHEPGDDKYGYEKAAERWLPVHTVETILLSVISMLADPNYESPANVDAAVKLYLVLFNSFIIFTFYSYYFCRKSGVRIPRNLKRKSQNASVKARKCVEMLKVHS